MSVIRYPKMSFAFSKSSLAKAELGWKPAMNAREALELTLQWYKTYYQDKGFISDLTEQQIQYFFSK